MNPIFSPFIATVNQTVQLYQLIQPKSAILCAISGGPDSMALILACQHLAQKYDLKLAIGHVHHGLREKNADRDAEFVKNFAEQADIPFHFKRVDVPIYQKKHKLCTEEAARELRYNALIRICQVNHYQLIAMGHHADDVAEQILMNIIRGTGPSGLTGIQPSRNISLNENKSIKIIRPLIHAYRTDILSFLNDSRQLYMHDETNDDIRFLRNRVRHHLIPELKSYNPNITSALNRLAEIQRVDSHWLDTMTQKKFEQSTQHADHRQVTMNAQFLKNEHPAIVRGVIRKAIQWIKKDLRRITHDHIQTLSQWLLTGDKTRYMNLPEKVRVEISQKNITIEKGKQFIEAPKKLYYCLEQPGKLNIPERNMILQLDLFTENLVEINRSSENHVFLDANVVSFPIVVRSIEPGDRFQPLGMGGHQKLKKFFINQKIPRSQRSQALVMISQGQIVWVIGYRISQSAATSQSTTHVIECRCNNNL